MKIPRGPRCLLPVIVAFLALLLSACSAVNESSIPSGLTVEEHALAGAPSMEPLAFTPLEGTMESVLALHAGERLLTIPDDTLLLNGRHALRLSMGSEELTATEFYDSAAGAGYVTLSRGQAEIYRIDTGMPSPIPGLQGLWSYDDHWVLETAYISDDAYGGRLSMDGALLCPPADCVEAFDFQLLAGRPFYFFRNNEEIGFSYNGRLAAAGYDEVPHYECCSASVLNPLHAYNMTAFFARRGGTWYYVEIGVFGSQAN